MHSTPAGTAASSNHARRGERTRRDSARERERQRDRETERHRESCAMASSQRRIASLAEQMRWLHACNDPECLGRCGECAVGAVGAAGSDHHALEEGSVLTCESPRPCRVLAAGTICSGCLPVARSGLREAQQGRRDGELGRPVLCAARRHQGGAHHRVRCTSHFPAPIRFSAHCR